MHTLLPSEFCSSRAELQDSANEALALAKRREGSREMKLTELHPCSIQRNKEEDNFEIPAGFDSISRAKL